MKDVLSIILVYNIHSRSIGPLLQLFRCSTEGMSSLVNVRLWYSPLIDAVKAKIKTAQLQS